MDAENTKDILDQFETSPSLHAFIKAHLKQLGLETESDIYDHQGKCDGQFQNLDGNLSDTDTIVVMNKCDLIADPDLKDRMIAWGITSADQQRDNPVMLCCLSCVTGEGMDDFINTLTNHIKEL